MNPSILHILEGVTAGTLLLLLGKLVSLFSKVHNILMDIKTQMSVMQIRYDHIENRVSKLEERMDSKDK